MFQGHKKGAAWPEASKARHLKKIYLVISIYTIEQTKQ